MSLIEKLRNLRAEQQTEQVKRENDKRQKEIEARQKQVEIERIKEDNKRTIERLATPFLQEINKEWCRNSGTITSAGEEQDGTSRLVWDMKKMNGWDTWKEISVTVNPSRNMIYVHDPRDGIPLSNKDWETELEDRLVAVLRSGALSRNNEPAKTYDWSR